MINDYQIISKGESFSPSVEVVGCFLEFDSKVLYIKRAPHISQGNTWCIPGGKLEKDETPIEGVIREIYEEVGVTIIQENLIYLGKLQIRRAEIDYLFHIFVNAFDVKPLINLCFDESTEARWLTIEEIEKLPLIVGGHSVLDYYQAWIKNPFIY